jgi:CheY-like chemotaxis protein/HPt (histidine-containing phosphotransfer) domain-containing protein
MTVRRPDEPVTGEGRCLDILLVEDNAINREILGEMLRIDGHDVTMAFDGREGVARASARRYDLVLMDISMPGMDGVEAARIIRGGTGPNTRTPIVAVTAHAMPQEVEKFRNSGMLRTLTKPIDRIALRQLLSEIAQSGPPSPASMPADAGHEASLIMDDARLAELSEIMEQPRFLDLIERFVAQGDAVAVMADGATPSSDPAAFIAEIHALAGVSGMLGAKALWEALVAVESAYHRDGKPISPKEREKFRQLWRETRAAYMDLSG